MNTTGIAKLWNRFISNYQKKSLQYILSISFTLAAVFVVVGVMIWSNYVFITKTEDQVIENHNNVIRQMNYNLDNHINNMIDISNTLYYGAIKNSDIGKNGIEEISSQMELLYKANDRKVVSVSIFDDSGTFIIAQPYSRVKPGITPQDDEWFTNANEEIENVNFSSPFVENLFVDSDNRFHWVISLSRSIEITNHGQILPAVLLVNMNLTEIEELCNNVELGESGYAYIIDKEGEIIYHPKQQLIYGGIEEENNKIASTYADGNIKESFNGEERIVTVKTVGYTGWKIIGVSPTKDITKIYTENQSILLVICCISILLLIIINMVLSSKVANPIKLLEKNIQELERNNWDAPICIGGTYEVRHLGETLQSMVITMKKLMKDIVKEQEGKRKSEMDVLQSQINPHFLYNTLDSVVWMIENERYEGAITMVTSLAKLFRISLSKGHSIITVEQELEHVRNYLIIQSVRYKERFKYYIEGEIEIQNCATIKLLIQPLVENAIYHAMEYMDDEGEISIKAYEKEKKLIFEVIDNGPGMPEDKVEELLCGNIKSSGIKGSGIGFSNVQQRVQLYFGEEDYGVFVESEPDEGTTIRLVIPLCSVDEMVRLKGGKYDA